MSVGMRPLVGGSHLLNALGVNSQEILQQLGEIQQRVGLLEQLGDSFAGGGLNATALAGMLQRGNIPGAGAMPPPACPLGGAGGFAAQTAGSLGANPNFFQALMNGDPSAMYERFLRQNPFARQQAEMGLGGQIRGIGGDTLSLTPFQGLSGLGGAAGTALGALDNINRGALASGLPAGLGTPNMFQSMIGGGLANILGGGKGQGLPVGPANGLFGGKGAPLGGLGGAAGGLGGAAGGLGALGGGGFGDDLGFNDPSLSVEDKVALLLTQIMKKMDKEIEAQANQLQALQGQQNGQGALGAGGKGAGGMEGGAQPSIDVESMKLKRLIDKRNQMFDTLRQIVDKYNQTAKGMIDSVGRT